MSYRIAMVGACPFPVPQGSQVYLEATARGLMARGHAVHLVVYAYGAGEAAPGLTVHRCPAVPGRRIAAGPSLTKPVADAALVATLRRVIRQERIDLVHAHNYEGLLVALAAGKRPIVYHAHNAMDDELPHYFRGAARRLARIGRWLDATFPRRADRVIAPHGVLGSYLVNVGGCKQDQVAVVPPPADPADFDAPAPPGGDPAVAYVGNLDAYQNLGLLYRAMERVWERRPHTPLRIGTASPPPTGRHTPPASAQVVPVPGLDALRAMLREDLVVAVPRVSWSGYPVKLLNAMAAGRPVVACRGCAHPVIDGETGIVVTDNDADAFAQSLIALLDDNARRAQMGDAAHHHVRNHHAPGVIAARIEALYDSLLGQGV